MASLQKQRAELQARLSDELADWAYFVECLEKANRKIEKIEDEIFAIDDAIRDRREDGATVHGLAYLAERRESRRKGADAVVDAALSKASDAKELARAMGSLVGNRYTPEETEAAAFRMASNILGFNKQLPPSC